MQGPAKIAFENSPGDKHKCDREVNPVIESPHVGCKIRQKSGPQMTMGTLRASKRSPACGGKYDASPASLPCNIFYMFYF